MRNLFLCFFALLLMSCGAAVAIDYDKKADFSSYKTYAFYPTIDSGLNDLDDNRIMKAVDSVLAQRPNFKKTEDPQLLINFFAKEYLSNSRNTIGIGVGGGGGNVGVGVSGGIPIGGKEVNQTLTIDFIDAQTDQLVWQAVVDGSFKERATPAQKESYYYTVISKALKKFPPKEN
ncbi:DUF4136 domain-containing protein [Altibacter lentus]|uniref:DUF4136 domain-containing protein n=1 Tax=Altibacter lentus TaxID=1223410 RepID=UPI000550FFEF|nr:DUF4136 domain-containing protein [Altibacter lentus]